MFTRLFIGNLSFQATAEDVRELFQHAGTVGRFASSPISSRGDRVGSDSWRWPRGKKPRRPSRC